MTSSRTTPTLTENLSSTSGNVRKIISNVLTSIAVATSPSPSAEACPHFVREETSSSKRNLMTRIRYRHSESSTKTRDGEESNSVSQLCNSQSDSEAQEAAIPDILLQSRLRRASFIYGEYSASKEESFRGMPGMWQATLLSATLLSATLLTQPGVDNTYWTLTLHHRFQDDLTTVCSVASFR